MVKSNELDMETQQNVSKELDMETWQNVFKEINNIKNEERFKNSEDSEAIEQLVEELNKIFTDYLKNKQNL